MFQSLAPTLLILPLPLLLLSYIRVGYQTQKFCKHCVLGILLSNFGVQQFGTQIWRIPFMWKIPSRLSIYLEKLIFKMLLLDKTTFERFQVKFKRTSYFFAKKSLWNQVSTNHFVCQKKFFANKCYFGWRIISYKKLAIISQPDYHV